MLVFTSGFTSGSGQTAFSPIFSGPYILRPMSELGQICAQIEALEVYFPMEQTSPPNAFCRKKYGLKSEGMSISTIQKMFKMSYLLHRMSELCVFWVYLQYFRETNMMAKSILPKFKAHKMRNSKQKKSGEENDKTKTKTTKLPRLTTKGTSNRLKYIINII